MPTPLPPLNALRVFDVAARHLSFTRAAAELGMTQAAVSYQVKLLEDRLKQPLFRRLTRQLVLTEAGARLAPAVSDAFGRLRRSVEALERSGGVLSITGVTTFTANWLVPRIGRFQVACPDIAVRLDISPRLVDFEREEFDIGIRGGRNSAAAWPGLARRPLTSIDLAAMGSPALLDAAGVAEPRDLLRLPLLGDHGGEWLAWFEAAGVAVGTLPPLKAQYTSQQMAATAVIAGQGVALLTPDFFRSEVRAGALVEPFGARLKATEDYYLVYLESRAGEPKIRAFCDWLIAELDAQD